MTLQVLIVDDEPLARARLRRLLAECREPEAVAAGEAGSAAHAMTLVRSQAFDVALLDVQMPGADGMALAAAWRELGTPPPVVFVTAHPEYAVQAFEVDAIDYLTKPVRLQRLQAALQKIVRTQPPSRDEGGGQPQFLTVAAQGRTERVALSDVIYFKAEDKYVVAQTGAEEYLLDTSLVQLERRHAARFLRIHRNALVARNAIRALARDRAGPDADGWVVELAGTDATLAVSRRQVSQIRAVLAGRAPAARKV